MSNFWKVNPQGLLLIQEFIISNLEKEVGIIPVDLRNQISQIIEFYIRTHEYEQAKEIFMSLIGSTKAIERLREIVEVNEIPLPPFDFQIIEGNGSNKRKYRAWLRKEDNRLLSGILRFGAEDWSIISAFVGNSRNRGQCFQRWSRILNPHLSKSGWSPDENVKLMNLVEEFGEKSWSKISKLMGNRSDVQCHYHYKQLIREVKLLTSQFNEQNQNEMKIINNPNNFNNPQPILNSQPNIIEVNQVIPNTENKSESTAPHVLLPSISTLLENQNIKPIPIDEFLQQFNHPQPIISSQSNNREINQLTPNTENRSESTAQHVLLPSISTLLENQNIKPIPIDEFLEQFNQNNQ